MPYKFLPHTADISFLVEGKSLEELFSFSALALKESITKEKIKEKISKKIDLKEKDIESLLYSFLEEILFLYEVSFFILSKVKKISIKEEKGGFSLEAVLMGDNIKNYKISNPIKAVTYSEMKIEKIENKFRTKIVLDA
ncbi:MAG: archease [Candidatus Pacearchaeota archaeon]